jgi:hypothetical protein
MARGEFGIDIEDPHGRLPGPEGLKEVLADAGYSKLAVLEEPGILPVKCGSVEEYAQGVWEVRREGMAAAPGRRGAVACRFFLSTFF